MKTKMLPVFRSIREQLVTLSKINYHRKDLGGWCAVSSYILFHILKRYGYKPVVHTNSYHAFLVCEGYYIDLTITQFSSYQGEKLPRIWCFKHGHPKWHETINSTEDGENMWDTIVRGWNQPISVTRPEIIDLMEFGLPASQRTVHVAIRNGQSNDWANLVAAETTYI